MKIGTVTLKNPYVLGPMAGVTDLPFRVLCKEMGAGLVCMEMVSAKALLYHNQKTHDMLRIDPQEHPISLQLFGSDPEVIREAAKMLEAEGIPFDILDLNMGCPVPKVVKNGEGSALLLQPDLVYQIVSETVKAIHKPVTVKIRKGFDDAHVNAVEVAKVIEAAGGAAVTVHGRTREQYYSGQADWDIIGQVKEAVSIPVIGNGDVRSRKDADALQQKTGCDGVMVARGARGNPWIFQELTADAKTGAEAERPGLLEVQDMILRHARLLIQEKGEAIGIREMRKQVAWYTKGFSGAAKLREMSSKICTYEELETLLNTQFTREASGEEY